jgi:hypothetical protein
MVYLGEYEATPHLGIVIRDLTLDGNLANQTTEYVWYGFYAWVCGGLIFENVYGGNVHGRAYPSVGGESTPFVVNNCWDVIYDKCMSYGVSGESGSGFMDNYCLDTHYVNCHAQGYDWCGFTTWHSMSTTFSDCTAWANSTYGFNCEIGIDVGYSNCQAGTQVPAWTPVPTPFIGASCEGNLMGFVASVGSKRTRYTGCIASWNTNGGFFTTDSSYSFYVNCTASYNVSNGFTSISSEQIAYTGCNASENTGNGINLYECERVVISGGEIIANVGHGLLCQQAATWAETHVSPETLITWNIGDVWVESAEVSRGLEVTGSRGGNAALASLLTQLEALNIITDSSS